MSGSSKFLCNATKIPETLTEDLSPFYCCGRYSIEINVLSSIGMHQAVRTTEEVKILSERATVYVHCLSCLFKRQLMIS